jgi:glycerol-3-phosphate dehydrogenase (NAD(P)+)
MPTIAVAGATSWGTTLAWLLARPGTDVWLVCRTEDEAAAVAARRGIARMPGLVLPERVRTTTPSSLPAALDGIVFVVPAQSMAANARQAAWPRQVPVLSAAKGIERESGERMSEVLAGAGWAAANIAVLSGPNLSHEIAAGKPAAAVAASRSPELARWWQQVLSTPVFRVYTSGDVVGVELGGALKNVIAIAAGAAAGLEFGTNAVAALMTRGLAEITRLGVACGAEPETFLGLSGVGDLAATCFSPLSRNQRFGNLLATGMAPTEALARIGEAVEGAATAAVALRLAQQRGVDMPITAAVAAVASGAATVTDAVQGLLARPLRPE